MIHPNYHGGGLLNLIASLTAACGGKPRHPLLTALPPDELAWARNVVFLLVDGLGYNYLADVGRGGALADHLAGKLTSVFPSTTASAITTTFTGLSPQEHGVAGWFGWFPEAELVIAPLPFRERGTDQPLTARGITPDRLFPRDCLFDALALRPYVVTAKRIVDSDYSRYFGGRAERLGYGDLTGMIDAIESVIRGSAERKYVYAYYPELDTVAHQQGIGSAQAANRLRAIDAAFAELLRRLSGTGTALVVSADHGFIDTPAPQALVLESYPALATLLRLPLTGEPRVAFCHVLPGRTEEFIAVAREQLDGLADVQESRALIEAGWFGAGTPHRRLRERVGEVTLLMRGTATIKDLLPGEKRHVLIGNHGGASEDEMWIPLVLARA